MGSDPLMTTGLDLMMLASRFTISDMVGGTGALQVNIDSISIQDEGFSVVLTLNDADLQALPIAGQTLYVNYNDSPGGNGILETESGTEITSFEASAWAMPPNNDPSGEYPPAGGSL